MRGERRTSERLGTSLVGRWKRGRKMIATRVADINAQGLFVATEEPIALGHVMNLVVDLPSGPIEFLGVSRNCGQTHHGRGIGVSIFSMDPKDRARWERHYAQGGGVVHSARQSRSI